MFFKKTHYIIYILLAALFATTFLPLPQLKRYDNIEQRGVESENQLRRFFVVGLLLPFIFIKYSSTIVCGPSSNLASSSSDAVGSTMYRSGVSLVSPVIGSNVFAPLR
ncbi:hypothetical protein BGZ63DRAFT_385379 [Mariannaea sp. PMI_226]|nr:hypothetical protein BGZ63DRAFT_385379 [Mariannaea sp. PMI_226]